MENFESKLLSLYSQTNQFGKLNGMELLSHSDGKIEYVMTIKQIHLATPTAAHGGVLAAYMDGVMGVAALTSSAKNKCLVSTVEFKINYLKPVLLGDVLTGKGSVISAGKRIIIAKGEIFNQKNELVSIATGTFNAYPYQKSGMVL
jgi:uncharacterized protein (TIGR00369 family)